MLDEKFWYIISRIDWDSAIETEDPPETAQKRYFHAVTSPDEQAQFRRIFYDYKFKINEETSRRLNQNQAVFAPFVAHGADDCFFMDLPAHLIGRGKAAVQAYLKGELVRECPVECLAYIFQKYEDH